MRFSRIILATNNIHKIREMSQLLADLQVEVLSKRDFPDFPDIEETGTTLAENALLKARAIYARYGIPAVADDTGLEVAHLNGGPGVLSARYAGAGCSFADNNRKLLAELAGVPSAQRGARFVTVIAISYEGGDQIVEGAVEGFIAERNRGENGFGYDPVFVYPPTGETFAEMGAVQKNSISHRGRALVKLREWLLSE
ncbi:MAG: RdgB/HAM1 family non-canonical purine NTP pyrophosphatase [bacterium]